MSRAEFEALDETGLRELAEDLGYSLDGCKTLGQLRTAMLQSSLEFHTIR